MRREILVLVACVVVIAASAAPAGSDPGARPFAASMSGQATFVPVSPAVCPPSELFLGGLRTELSTTGTALHMGKTEMDGGHCTPAGDEITGGRMALVAANGDKVYIEYSGTAPFPSGLEIGGVIAVDGEFTVVGGTGRFVSATGEGTFDAEVIFEGFEDPEWPATFTFAGTIGY